MHTSCIDCVSASHHDSDKYKICEASCSQMYNIFVCKSDQMCSKFKMNGAACRVFLRTNGFLLC